MGRTLIIKRISKGEIDAQEDPNTPHRHRRLEEGNSGLLGSRRLETREHVCRTNNINILSIIWHVILQWHGLSGIEKQIVLLYALSRAEPDHLNYKLNTPQLAAGCAVASSTHRIYDSAD